MRNIWVFSPLVPSKREKNIHWFCSVCIFFEGSFFTFQFLNDKIHNYYLVQLIKQPILRIPNSTISPVEGVAKCFYLFSVNSYIGIFGCIVSGKNTQKVNTQKIRCTNSGFLQRYTYRVLQTIQMQLILLCVWAEPAVLGCAKTD